VLFSRLQELNKQITSRRDQILNDLTILGYKPELFSGVTAQNIFQLSILNKYISRLNMLVQPGRLPPSEIYLELCSFLGELAALQPLRDLQTCPPYDHFDCAPQFNEMIMRLRALLLVNGEMGFLRINFEQEPGKQYLTAKLSQECIFHAQEYYLAVHCDAEARPVIDAVEEGDFFRLLSPRNQGRRIRGVKLTENRYPPRYFPALPDTLWFRLDCDESSRVWHDIIEERS